MTSWPHLADALSTHTHTHEHTHASGVRLQTERRYRTLKTIAQRNFPPSWHDPCHMHRLLRQQHTAALCPWRGSHGGCFLRGSVLDGIDGYCCVVPWRPGTGRIKCQRWCSHHHQSIGLWWTLCSSQWADSSLRSPWCALQETASSGVGEFT